MKEHNATNEEVCDSIELLLQNKEEMSEYDKKLFRYMHKFNRYMFLPFVRQVQEHIKDAQKKYEMIEGHIAREDELKKQWSRIEALLWALAIIAGFIGVDLLAKILGYLR